MTWLCNRKFMSENSCHLYIQNTIFPSFLPKTNNLYICTYPLSLLVSDIQSVMDRWMLWIIIYGCGMCCEESLYSILWFYEVILLNVSVGIQSMSQIVLTSEIGKVCHKLLCFITAVQICIRNAKYPTNCGPVR
jgi:hypothetical protein